MDYLHPIHPNPPPKTMCAFCGPSATPTRSPNLVVLLSDHPWGKMWRQTSPQHACRPVPVPSPSVDQSNVQGGKGTDEVTIGDDWDQRGMGPGEGRDPLHKVPNLHGIWPCMYHLMVAFKYSLIAVAPKCWVPLTVSPLSSPSRAVQRSWSDSASYPR